MGNKQTKSKKRPIEVVAMAAIERLGKDSPASLIATNRFLLKYIDEILKSSIISKTKIIACGGLNHTWSETRSVEIFDTSRWRG